MDLMKIEHIQFFYDPHKEFEVIHDISFNVRKGEFVSVIGPSGCGKSTLLRIIAGLMKPAEGKVLYMNREIKAPISEISFVFQDFALLPWLTNIENVKLGLSLSTISDDAKENRARELLDQFGLTGFEDSYPNVLSGGMRQRVGIARALVSKPKVLLMDEPFSSLDEITANSLRKEVVSMLKSKKISVDAVIMVTHNVEEAVELSNRVVVLSGKPAHVKAVEEIRMSYPRNKHAKEFLNMVDRLDTKLTK